MQTFLPYPDFHQSARCLDNKRLGKQRVEAYQILELDFPNHPATKMWIGYESALCYYGFIICEEWKNRGFVDNLQEVFEFDDIILPPWIGGKIHGTHRAALLFKDYHYYSQFNWEEKPEMRYHWP